MITICTFNANNLFVRYRFGSNFVGAPINAPKPPDSTNPDTTSSRRSGFLPAYTPGSFEVFNESQRLLAATALTRGGTQRLPDLLVLQEIESLIALRVFNERYLDSYYTQALLVDSRDYRQIDVGVLAGPRVQVEEVRTNVDLLAENGEAYKPGWPWQFSRDCLEVVVRLPRRILTVYVNHFKSKFVQPEPGQTKDEREAEEKLASEYRLRQAKAVVDIVRDRHSGTGFSRDWFVVAGDFNALSDEEPATLMTSAGLEDVLSRLPRDERWTEYYESGGSVGQLDYLFVSPALSQDTAGTIPYVERRGIGMREASKVDGRPLPKVARLEVADDQPRSALSTSSSSGSTRSRPMPKPPITARCSSTSRDRSAPTTRRSADGQAASERQRAAQARLVACAGGGDPIERERLPICVTASPTSVSS